MNYALRRRRRVPRTHMCMICGQAPATRLLHYSGMQGVIAACSKKMHDLTALERAKAKSEHSRKKWAQRILQAKDPLNAGIVPKLGAYIKNTYKKMKFAVTRGDR